MKCCVTAPLVARLLPLVGMACGLLGSPARAEVTATAYSLTYRGPASASPEAGHQADTGGVRWTGSRLVYTPPPPTVPLRRVGAVGPVMRVVNGRTGAEITRASFDPNLNGYFFTLPPQADMSQDSVCLLLKGTDGRSIPVRAENGPDDGYAFRNPLWEEVLRTGAETQQLQAEQVRLTNQIDSLQREVVTLNQALATASRGPSGECALGPAQAEPSRPADAVPPSQANADAAGICAAKTDETLSSHRIDGTRLFADAGLASAWAARTDGRAAAARYTGLAVGFSSEDLAVLKTAAEKGKIVLDHAEAVRAVQRSMSACGAAVVQKSTQALERWEAAKLAAVRAPASAKQMCETQQARLDQAQAAHGKATAFHAALAQRLAKLAQVRPASNQVQRIDSIPCPTT